MLQQFLIRRKQLTQEAEGYLELGMYSHALQSLSQLDDDGARKPHSLYLRGESLHGLERYDEAIEWLEQSAEAESENYHVFLALGWCQKRCDRVDLAIQSLHRALDAADGEAIIHYNLACYYSLTRRKHEAIDYLTRAFELDSHYRDLVAEEPDFEPLRDDPDFQDLTSVIA